MKKELSPGTVAAVIACVVVVAIALLWKSNASKPAYPGADAPTAEAQAGTEKKPGGTVDMSPNHRTIPNGGKITQEQAEKMNIPGVGHKPASGQ